MRLVRVKGESGGYKRHTVFIVLAGLPALAAVALIVWTVFPWVPRSLEELLFLLEPTFWREHRALLIPMAVCFVLFTFWSAPHGRWQEAERRHREAVENLREAENTRRLLRAIFRRR